MLLPIIYIVCFALSILATKSGIKKNDSLTKKVGVVLGIISGIIVCVVFDIGVDSGPMLYTGSGAGMNVINLFLAFVFGALPMGIGIYLGNHK